MRFFLSAFVAGAAAQSSYLLPSNPGGAVPAGVQAPSISGFKNPTIQPSRGGLAVCVSGIVSVTAHTSKNFKFDFEVPQNQSQTTETYVALYTNGSPFLNETIVGMQSAGGTFDIAATLCTPANDTSPQTVQLLTHGIGFDRYYWDFAPGYSFVDVAVAQGYATFSYDRLGVGESAKPDGLNVIQAPLEIEIANELALSLGKGTYSNTTFTKVIGVGHSFGSGITHGVTAEYPSTLSAAILTGYSVNNAGSAAFSLGLNFAIASQNQPYRFASLRSGFLVAGEAISNQIAFFRAPNFSPDILAMAEATKQTVTWGELFSAGLPISNFTRPVAVVDGENDLRFCYGNCTYPTNLAAQVKPALYPDLANDKFGTYLVSTTGHGINLHYSATSAFTWIQNFLKKQGL